MILESMLNRLYASLQKGPSLNARPHNSRQRIDLSQLARLESVSPDAVLPSLLGVARKLAIPAAVPSFVKPDYPPDEWSDEQRQHRDRADQQSRIVKKLQDIAIDAQDYYNDHGEEALFIGFPLLSIPASGDPKNGGVKNRILAPAAFIPISLSVQKGARTAISIKTSGEGSDLLIPNPALLAWIEQQTGRELPELFDDDTGDDPQREFSEILAFISKAIGLEPAAELGYEVSIVPIPKAEDLPAAPAVLPCAVLGLFPLTNPGMLRDTKHMIEHEASLNGPIKAFLRKEALQPAPAEPAAEDSEPTADPVPAADRRFDDEFFIAPIDPCQSRTAAIARDTKALVIHGPPGTGKSQTITNIIGDHLARGQRVLFVCDKRTALDVVKYRLDHCGLGELCGIIHDPARDRKTLYLNLRERLERLAENEPLPNPAAELSKINAHLDAIDKELKQYFRLLHKSDTASFHDTVGEWLARKRVSSGEIQLDASLTKSLTIDLVEQAKIDIGEILHRARESRLAQNPFFEQLSITLPQLYETTLAKIRERFAAYETLAAQVDQSAALPPLHPDLPLLQQADTRNAIAAGLESIAAINRPEILLKAGSLPPADLSNLRNEIEARRTDLAKLATPLDRELELLASSEAPTFAALSQQSLDIEAYLAIHDTFLSFLQFGKKKAAANALKRFALPLDKTNAERALAFTTGLKSRHLLSDTLNRFLGGTKTSLIEDRELAPAFDTLIHIDRLLERCDAGSEQKPSHASQTLDPTALLSLVQSAFVSDNSIQSLSTLAISLRRSAERARAIDALSSALAADSIFSPESISAFDRKLRANHAASPTAQAWTENLGTLENVIRLESGLSKLSPALKPAVREIALQELERENALNEVASIALRNAIQSAIQTNPNLLDIDTARINAAFDEYGQRLAEKQAAARDRIAHFWQNRQRNRFLATTGSRLNSDGANLRNRLFIRGKRSLKLRQMIAVGENDAGGDPLFDLCPVWMASPSTVAQIFPRLPIFDLVVFDEASQCRLEEALPVLLRSQRVVIAGDPKQLPPTRFFESGIVESDDTGAETIEELADLQMSETEDLLNAALNLDVDEAFLDVHYRSHHEALIGFSNQTYYNDRLQPIPGHPKNKALKAPITILHVNGLYKDRSNPAEALAVAELVSELLDDENPPSIGIACFNINQRDLIIDALNDRAQEKPDFGARYATARQRRGRDSFEGLFVRNLENVQGDERDHIIISTTFGLDSAGKFRRNFGALSQQGGERRLNVLVTRARKEIHILTSIPTEEYRSPPSADTAITGRHHLYAYLRYAEQTAASFESYQDYLENLRGDADASCDIVHSSYPSRLAQELALELQTKHNIGSTVHWGNDGFCVDVALTHPSLPEDVTIGVLADFNRFRKTPDPIAWEHFRTEILKSQGWRLHRIWSPIVSREPDESLATIQKLHQQLAKTEAAIPSEIPADDQATP